jgi:hypothetical protein
VILHGSGALITNTFFNGYDGSSQSDGLAVVSGEGSLAGMFSSDNRVSSTDVEGAVRQLQVSGCSFITGGNDVRVFNDISMVEIGSSSFSSSGPTIANFGGKIHLSNCNFKNVGEEAIIRDQTTAGATSTITGCTFKDFGQKNGEAAIRIENNTNHRIAITGNAFRSVNGATEDVKLVGDVQQVQITGNLLLSGVSGEMSGRRFSRNTTSSVVCNSINPIGFSRSTPSTPSETKESVTNTHLQGAWVYHNGKGPRIWSFGSDHSLPTEQSPVFVPRGGQISFESSVPSDWNWWWI